MNTAIVNIDPQTGIGNITVRSPVSGDVVGRIETLTLIQLCHLRNEITKELRRIGVENISEV